MLVISNKAYRFKHPTIKLLDSLTEEYAKGKIDPEKRAYCDVKPGSAPGAFGEPTQIPDWAKTDGMFKAALANRNLMILPDVNVEPEVVVRKEQDKAAIAATLATAQRQVEAVALGGAQLEVGSIPADDTTDALASLKADNSALAADNSKLEPSTTSNKKPGKK
jgi:hypothetical protein